MTMPRKRILLALDGSDASLETVRYVAKIFPVARTEVVLFHVAAKASSTGPVAWPYGWLPEPSA